MLKSALRLFALLAIGFVALLFLLHWMTTSAFPADSQDAAVRAALALSGPTARAAEPVKASHDCPCGPGCDCEGSCGCGSKAGCSGKCSTSGKCEGKNAPSKKQPPTRDCPCDCGCADGKPCTCGKAKHAHLDSYAEAYHAAVDNNKPLVLWVGGFVCPYCEAGCTDLVHGHVDSFQGDDSPRAIVSKPDGEGGLDRRGVLTTASCSAIRALLVKKATQAAPVYLAPPPVFFGGGGCSSGMCGGGGCSSGSCGGGGCSSCGGGGCSSGRCR